MATVDKYTIQMDVTGQAAVDKLKSSMGGLGSVIASIGVAAFIKSTIDMADAISDLSDATGLSISNIVTFREALQLAGGKADNAGKMIATFFNTLEQAATGSESAQKALQDVGISFNDLKTKSEAALLNEAVANLGAMEAGARRTADGIKVFGKAFRDIDPTAMTQLLKTGNYDEVIAGMKRLAAHADAMHTTMNNLQLAFAKLADQALTALEPIIGKLDDTGLKLDQAEKVIKLIGIALGVAFGAKVVLTIIEIVGAVSKLYTALKGVAILQIAMNAMTPKGLIMLGVGALAAAGGYLALNEALKDYEDGMKGAQKVGGVETPAGNVPSSDTTTKKPAFANAQLYSDAERQARHQALIAAKEQTKEIGLQNTNAQKYQQILNDTIGIEQSQADIIKMNASLQQDADQKILDLNKQIAIENAKGRGANADVVIELEKQKTQVYANLDATKKLKAEELSRLLIQRELVEKNALTFELYGKITNSLDKYRDSYLTIKDLVEGTITAEEASRRGAKQSLENQQLAETLSLEQQYNDAIIKGDTIAAQSAKERLASAEAIHGVQRMSLDLENQKTDALRKSGVAGAREAFDQIARSMDPYQKAQDQVNAAWGNITKSIDNFVDTGKFSFNDLTSSILKDMVKIELKALAMEAMGWFKTLLFGDVAGGKGGTGLLSLIGGFFAEGGQPPMGKASIVGEKGPELFIPRSAGTIVPNNQLGGAGGGQQVTNNHVTNNHYNVQAVDAKSVAQLFAENRKTLLGTMQMAQKELPYNNR